MKVSIVYWSGTGNTEAMANAIMEGVESKGVEVELLQVSAANESVLNSDVLFLGCPAMGCEQLEDSEFEPFFDSIKSGLAGKKVGLFGSYDWGDGEWMRTFTDMVLESGAELIADGLIANGTPGAAELEACKALGASVK